jgi:uncharacterized membrane protein YidH (DUF202 family)
MTAAAPPPRPSTARLSAPPIAARQDVPRPGPVVVSCRLWLLAGALAVLTVMVALTQLDLLRAELARVARDSDPSATTATVERVVNLSVLVIIVGGALLGVASALFALGLRAGRRWARLTLATLTLLAIGYAVLVVSATGWLVLAYAAVSLAAAVCMYLPAASHWLR